MRTVETKVYNFDELTDGAKIEALAKIREQYDTTFNMEEVLSTLEKAAEHFSMRVMDYGIGTYNRNFIEIDTEGYMNLTNADKNELVNWLNENIQSGSDGSCLFTGVIYDCFFFDYFMNDGVEVTFNNLHNEVVNGINYAMEKGVESIENEFEDDEYIASFIEANEYEFTEDGQLFY